MNDLILYGEQIAQTSSLDGRTRLRVTGRHG